MNSYLLTLIIASEVVAIFLLYGVWQSKEHLLWKLLGTLVGALPFIGPVCILYLFKAPPVQRPEMQNRGPRGDYTHHWLSLRGILGRDNKEEKK